MQFSKKPQPPNQANYVCCACTHVVLFRHVEAREKCTAAVGYFWNFSIIFTGFVSCHSLQNKRGADVVFDTTPRRGFRVLFCESATTVSLSHRALQRCRVELPTDHVQYAVQVQSKRQGQTQPHPKKANVRHLP